MPKTPDQDFYGTVVRREQLTPHLVRLVFGGPGLAGWHTRDDATDAYLVFYFPAEGAPYEVPFSVKQVHEDHPADLWPSHRHYTVRAWDEAAGELTVDFVVHGDEGLAGPWAGAAQVGDRIVLSLPGGGYRPDPDADWHLMVGDESAFPAIAAALEALRPDATAIAVLLCDGPGDELALTTPATLDVRWHHRRGEPADAEILDTAVRSLEFPPGRVHAFVHGEAGEVRAVRRHLFAERAIPRADVSVSGYWRRTMTDEAWRRIKRDWNAAVEADTPTA